MPSPDLINLTSTVSLLTSQTNDLTNELKCITINKKISEYQKLIAEYQNLENETLQEELLNKINVCKDEIKTLVWSSEFLKCICYIIKFNLL